MNQLHLSLAKGREQNVAALLSFLASRKPTPSSPVPVYVCLSQTATRSCFLDLAQHLYNTVLEHAPNTAINVIPVSSTADAAGGSSNPPTQTVTRSGMTASPGFQPCYRYVAVGGTFDHLHSGHKLLLSTAVLHATEKLRVGVTGDELLQRKKYREHLQPISVRMQHVRAFLETLRTDVELEIDAIADVSGGTDVIEGVEAIVLSPETEASLSIINDLRQKNGFRPLAPIRIPYVETSTGTHISSTLLREQLARTAAAHPPTSQ